MFDPTVYENVKVVLEGAVYDLDLSGRVRVTNREDVIDLSSMSRRYAIRFADAHDLNGRLFAEIHLKAHLSDLASEIMETHQPSPGCKLEIFFEETVGEEMSIDDTCRRTDSVLKEIWGERFAIRQTISYAYDSQPIVWRNRTMLDFGRKFNEDVIEDIPDLLEHVLRSIQRLSE